MTTEFHMVCSGVQLRARWHFWQLCKTFGLKICFKVIKRSLWSSGAKHNKAAGSTADLSRRSSEDLQGLICCSKFFCLLHVPRFNMFLPFKMSMSIAITFATHFFQGGGALRANGGCPGCCKSDRHGGPFCWDKVRPSSFSASPNNCHVHHFQVWFLVNIVIF